MSFRFHYFNNKLTYKRPFSARKLISTMNLRYANNNNYNNLNINTVRSLQLSHDINSNMKIKKFILSKNLEKELNSNNLNEILQQMLIYNNYLPDDIKIEDEKMIDNDIECSNIISCFQLLIKFLFEKKTENEKYNNILEQKINSLKDESYISKLNEKIDKNEQKINQLERKKYKIKAFLKNNGIKFPSENNKKLYICNLCPEDVNKFDNYRSFHQHYVKTHINPFLFYDKDNNRNINNELNYEFDKKYFDNKIDDFLEEMKITLKSKSQQIIKKKHYKEEDIDTNNNMLKSQNISEKNDISRKKYDLIKERMEKLENNRREFEKKFKINVDNFLKEFKNEIEKLKGN